MSAETHGRVGHAGRKYLAIAVALALFGGAFISLPQATQNATGYMTPGTGMMLTFMDLAMMSDGAVVEIGANQFLVNETITVMPSDTLMLTGMEDVFFRPFAGISLEILGTFDAMMGFGALFHSAGPGSWEGIEVNGGLAILQGVHITDAVNGINVNFGQAHVQGCTISNCMNDGISVINSGIFIGFNTLVMNCGNAGISLDNPMQIQPNLVENSQISGCTVGIHMLDGAGGPTFFGNTVENCLRGYWLGMTSAQIINNDIRFNDVGVYGEGINMSPSLMQNRIYGNVEFGVRLDQYSMNLHQNTIKDNGNLGVYVWGSAVMMSENQIYGRNATLGSNQPGMDAIAFTGWMDWGGQSWISQNWIIGGNGDENQDGGHAILIEEMWGNASNAPQIDNIVIDSNHIIRGGDGGINNMPGGTAGDGGSAIYVMNLPNEEDHLSDQQSLIVENNLVMRGGRGGDNMVPDGFAGHGGKGICVLNDYYTGIGNIRVSDNAPIYGGDGGTSMNPMTCGAGGCALDFKDVTMPGSRVSGSLLSPQWAMPGADGGPLPPFIFGGCGLKMERCEWMDVWQFTGNSQWSLIYENNSNHNTFSDISIQDSNANSGNLVRAENSQGSGNNENWNFGGMNGVSGVLMNNCTELKLTGGNFKVSNATAMEFRNSGNISLDDLSFNVTDGNGLVMNWTWNVDLFNMSMEMWWVDPFEIDYGVYIEDSEDVDAGGLVMKWDQKDSPGTGYSSAWKYSYGCEDSGNCTVSNSTLTGGKAKADNCHNVQFVDSFFDVTYNTTGINNTGISIFNTSGAKVQNTTVKTKNATGLKNMGANGTFIVDSFFDVFTNITTGNFTGLDIFKSNNTRVQNTTVKTKNATGLKNMGANGTFIVDSFFDVYNTSLPGNFTGVDIFKSKNTKIQNSTVKAKNATGLKNMASNGTFIVDSFFDVTYEDIGGDPAISITDSFDVRLEAVDILVRNVTGVNITDSTRVNLAGISIDGTGSTHPSAPNRGIESYGWEFGGIQRSNVTGTKGDGVNLTKSKNLNVTGNNVSNSGKTGFKLVGCSNVNVYHNNILNNAVQASDDTGLNSWHNGYPSGGNYWSDYVGPDIMSGPMQDQPGPDGIGDVPYINILGGTGAEDRYPLAEPWVPAVFNINLHAGWNLISVPLETDGTDILDVLASISGKYDSVKYYGALEPMHWLSHRPGASTDTLHAVDSTMGIWINAIEPCTLSVSGSVPGKTMVTLHAGWNLVGYPSMAPTAANIALAGTGFTRIECYDPASPYIREMDPAEMMVPGCGYWVHVPATVVWVINP